MSTSENHRAALLILSGQLAQLTYYGESEKNGTSQPPGNARWDTFLANFELILDAINSVTRDNFSPTVKKTILVSQFRGYPREVLLKHHEDWKELGYEEFLAFVGNMVRKCMI